MEYPLTLGAEPTPNFSELGTVLLVDDDPLILRCLKRALESCPYHIAACGTAREALEHIFRDRVDAIICDMSMPEMSGLDLLCEVRKFDVDIPVVLLSGISCCAVADEAMELGAFKYLTKPITPDALCAVVTQAAQSCRAKRVARHAEGAAADA